jgi:L-alanine-DL-glutamate epimerase-like enolase superfamily enzyme
MTATVIVEVATEDRLRGYGYTYQFDEAHAAAVSSLVEAMAPAVVGAAAADVKLIWVGLSSTQLSFLGLSGLGRWAQGALDMALWDLRCKELGLTLAELIGVATSPTPTYFSGLLVTSPTPEDLHRRAVELRDRGATAYKVGATFRDVGLDRERLAAARDVLGPEGLLLVDSGQALDFPKAARVAPILHELDLYWWEDVLAVEDLNGLRRLGEASPVPLATGENLSTVAEFKQLFDLGTVSYVLVDLQRVGGITPWYDIAALARAYEVKVSAHMFTHIGRHLLRTISNPAALEYVPYWDGLFGEPVTDGEAILATPPGTGLEPLRVPD